MIARCSVSRVQSSGSNGSSPENSSQRFPDSELLRNSLLFREFTAEREEILRLKWIESEKAGHDIGMERAVTDWVVHHRSDWKKMREEQRSTCTAAGKKEQS